MVRFVCIWFIGQGRLIWVPGSPAFMSRDFVTYTNSSSASGRRPLRISPSPARLGRSPSAKGGPFKENANGAHGILGAAGCVWVWPSAQLSCLKGLVPHSCMVGYRINTEADLRIDKRWATTRQLALLFFENFSFLRKINLDQMRWP